MLVYKRAYNKRQCRQKNHNGEPLARAQFVVFELTRYYFHKKDDKTDEQLLYVPAVHYTDRNERAEMQNKRK